MDLSILPPELTVGLNIDGRFVSLKGVMEWVVASVNRNNEAYRRRESAQC